MIDHPGPARPGRHVPALLEYMGACLAVPLRVSRSPASGRGPEHLPRPREALTAVWCALAPGGVVAVAVPSTLNLLSARIEMTVYRFRGRSKTLRLPPYHLFEHTPRSPRAMLEISGSRVETLEQSAVPLGKMALRGSLVENVGKAVFRLLAHAGAFACNRGGNRLLAVGVRPGDGAGVHARRDDGPMGQSGREVTA